MNVRVMIVDDHVLVAEGLEALVKSRDGIDVVGQAVDGRAAVSLALELKPDVVLMDMSMPEMNGIDATTAILRCLPDTRIVMLSMYSNPEYVHRALEAGVSAYLLKRTAAHNLVEAILAVHAGRHFFSEQITEIVVHRYLDGESSTDVLSVLSARERQVLQLLAESKSVLEIADTLSLSPKTIETYRSRLFNKLGLKDIAGLVRLAIRQGVISLE